MCGVVKSTHSMGSVGSVWSGGVRTVWGVLGVCGVVKSTHSMGSVGSVWSGEEYAQYGECRECVEW